MYAVLPVYYAISFLNLNLKSPITFPTVQECDASKDTLCVKAW
jgi:hypothetical protein